MKYRFRLLLALALIVTGSALRAQDDAPVAVSQDELLEEMLVSEDDLIVEDAPEGLLSEEGVPADNALPADEEVLLAGEEVLTDEAPPAEALERPFEQPKKDRKDDAIFMEDPEAAGGGSADEGGKSVPDGLNKPAAGQAPSKGNKAGSGIDVAAFEDLLRENMDIRKAADAYADEAAALKQEIADVRKLALDLEAQLAGSVGMIQTLKKEKEAAEARITRVADAPKVAGDVPLVVDDAALATAKSDLMKTKEQLATLTAENAFLKADYKNLTESLAQGKSAAPAADNTAALDEARSQIENITGRLNALMEQNATLVAQKTALEKQLAEAVAPADRGDDGGKAPQVGSDLFQALEQQNFAQKEQIKTLDAEKAALQVSLAALEAEKSELQTFRDAATERENALRREIAEAVKGQDEYKGTISKLLEHVPGMEEELAGLKNAVDVKESTIQSKERELSTLREELERREIRIIKAERMATLLKDTSAEVSASSNREKRDMHFNMAVVYMKEGNFRGAEQEYLHALRIDPTDADTHYNLAILYDDHMGDTRRAARHYRAYLKLAPNADDVDQVKSWLVALELQ